MTTLTLTGTQLSQALQDWPVADAPEYVANLPTLIRLGELRLIKDLNLEIFDKTVATPVVTSGSRAVTKPTDFVAPRSLWLVLGGVITGALLRRSREFCEQYAPDATVQGTPKYYADDSTTGWNIVPTPNTTGVVKVHYVARPASVMDVPGTLTWLGTYCADALLAACLAESEQYLKADDRYADMIKKYATELVPVLRLELRNLLRTGDYDPFLPAAQAPG